jgi:hypothetical protein
VSGPERGVVFPEQPDGRRSTSATGRTIVSRALQPVDPTGARDAERETTWRTGYLDHFRRAVLAGIADPDAWLTIARAGLDAVHDELRFAAPDGSEVPVREAVDAPAAANLATVEVTGDAEPAGFALPYRGELLRGDDVRRRVARWVEDGIVDAAVAPAIDAVLDNPDWLRLEGRTVAVLGAGSEMGPAGNLLRWGATVAAIDLPDPAIWQRLIATGRRRAGRLLVPAWTPDVIDDVALAQHAGADLVTDPTTVGDWIAELPGQVTIGNYVYADGGLHVRLSTAIDLLTERVRHRRDDVALAFLATPTDVFVVPREVVDRSTARYEERSRTSKLLGRPLRTVSRGKLLQRAYVPGEDPGLSDVLIAQQGPNYALAKRIQRWRAAVARDEGTLVSFHVAPSTRTRSVTKNRALAAAFAGAHRFGIEVFDPATSNTLMAALLVHDLHQPAAPHDHPWQDEAHAAAHGGLWTAPYAPRSALGLAALLGYVGRG